VERVFRGDPKYRVFQSPRYVALIVFIMSFFQIGNALLSTYNEREVCVR
jgi:hypothetical protein